MNTIIYSIAAIYSFILLGMFILGSNHALRTKNKRIAPLSMPVSIIKPVKGADENFERFTRSWLDQDYKGPVQYVFSFQDADDYGIVVLKQLMQQYPDKDIELIVNPIRNNYSGKASNLYYGVKKAKYDFIVFSDSDTIAHPNVISQLLTPFVEMDKVGAVTSFVNSTEAGSLGAILVGNAMNAIFLSIWALIPLGVKVGVAGGSVALQKSTLSRIGGINAFAPYVADDLKLGHLISSLGLKIVAGPYIESPVGKFDLLECFNRLHRGQLAMRHMVPVSQYLLFTLSNMLYIPVFVTGLIVHSKAMLIAALIMFICKSLVGLISNLTLKNPWYTCLIIPLFDLISIITTVSSLIYSRLVWRGVTYNVDDHGRLSVRESHQETKQYQDELHQNEIHQKEIHQKEAK